MAHIHDRIDFCVEVFIVHNNRVLLRMHDKYKVWLSVGGHIELDEDPNEAALREVREEVGLSVELWDSRTEYASDDVFTELIPPVALGKHETTHPTSPKHEHVALVYFATARSTEVAPTYDGDRSDEIRWFSAQELEDIEIRPNVKAYALRALAALRS